MENNEFENLGLVLLFTQLLRKMPTNLAWSRKKSPKISLITIPAITGKIQN